MRGVVYVAASLLLLVGCSDILGIERGSPSGTAGAGAGAGGADGGAGPTVGGSGGTPSAGGGGGMGGAVVHANDWSPFMAAVYPLEQMLETDASPHGSDLFNFGCMPRVGDPPQGMAVATCSTNAYLSHAGDTTPPFTNDIGFAFGGWFRIDDDFDAAPISRIIKGAGPAGFELARLGAGARCSIADNATEHTVTGGVWQLSEWAHVVCWFDANAQTLTLFFNGEPVAVSDLVNLQHAPIDLVIGGDFSGDIDEAFFFEGELAETYLRRLYGCNVDGTACDCSPSDATAYTRCRLADCGSLPPCNANPAP